MPHQAQHFLAAALVVEEAAEQLDGQGAGPARLAMLDPV